MEREARTRLNLTFHGIGAPPPDTSASERRVWVSEDVFLAILDAVRDEARVRITFDDGNRSDHALALPALAERGLVATFFALAGRLGRADSLGASELRELAGAGMKIGLHGMDHRVWRGLSPADTERELDEARSRLEEAVGEPVLEAACPFGAYDRKVLGELRQRGFERVYTSDPLPAREGDWFQPRHSLHAGEGPEDVLRWLRQGFSPGRALQRAKVFLKTRRGAP